VAGGGASADATQADGATGEPVEGEPIEGENLESRRGKFAYKFYLSMKLQVE
jgi:hypothetical protein